MNSDKNHIAFYSALILLLLMLSGLLVTPGISVNDDLSTVVLSREGRLLGAKIADDEQWRFPIPDSIPYKFEQALLSYEDKRFYQHNGIDVIRLTKALYDNVFSGSVKSGASTISMQLARISRNNPPRTLANKLLEIGMALKTELIWSKEKILKTYAGHAPFGGNIIGLETASWKYYNKEAWDLSWAEAATLAVLPNSPGLIHPGRKRSALLKKRNQLLYRLEAMNIIDEQVLALSLLEELPEKPYPIPQNSLHLVEYLSRKKAHRGHTTIDYQLQQSVVELATGYYEKYSQNAINNLSILVVENSTGKVVAYVGNTRGGQNEDQEFYIDMIQRGRSTGSILKPILYAYCLDQGLITPRQLLPDIPGNINGYRPRNFTREFEGAVQAEKALIRSLNVPFVFMLKDYTIDKFLYHLQDLGFSHINRSADYYGLPLILGGADATLWELVSVYSGMARSLENFNTSGGFYFSNDFHRPVFRETKDNNPLITQAKTDSPPEISAGAIWQTFSAMLKVERPSESGQWAYYNNPLKIAWKTGTSYGFKDAWSVGVSKQYTVGVWVGNATGEGRQGLVGVKVAAPVLFSVLDLLPYSSWFEEPADDLKMIEICSASGFPATLNCEHRDTQYIPYRANPQELCPYHKKIRTDASGRWRLDAQCTDNIASVTRSFLVLPPLMEYYYLRKHPEYKQLPDFHPSCQNSGIDEVPMAFIYPAVPSKIKIPVEYSGERGRVVFRLAHRNTGAKVFWYLDDEFITSTVDFHEIEFLRAAGDYNLLVIDDKGNRLNQQFSVME